MPNYTISAKTSGKSGVAIDTSTFGSLGQMVSVVLTNLISNNSLTGTPEHISISIPTMVSGTNLTSMGRVTTLFVGTAWRLRNGAAGDLNGTLQSEPNPLVFSNTYDLPRNTDTFVISPFVAGPANHKLTIGADSYPKASLNTPFSTGPDLTINDNYTLIGSLFNDTLSASNGNDTVVGGDGADSLKGGAGKDEFRQGSKQSIAPTNSTFAGANFAPGDTITFGFDLDVISDFSGTEDKLSLDSPTDLVTAIGVATTGLTGGTNYYLSGTYNFGTKVFTISANGVGPDTLIIQGYTGEGTNFLTNTSSFLLDNFNFDNGIVPPNIISPPSTSPPDVIVPPIVPPDDILKKLNTPFTRFQNMGIPGTYLFAGPTETANIRQKFPEFKEEGIAFKVGIEPDDNLLQITRFQNMDRPGTYLFAGPGEAANIRQNFPGFKEEGIAFYALDSSRNLGTQIYRFQNMNVPGTYLFVAAEERDSILANFPNFRYEGEAFEVAV